MKLAQIAWDPETNSITPIVSLRDGSSTSTLDPSGSKNKLEDRDSSDRSPQRLKMYQEAEVDVETEDEDEFEEVTHDFIERKDEANLNA